MPRRLPIPSRATATWTSLWVSTPRVIAWASAGVHRLTSSSSRSADEHRSPKLTRAEPRRTALRWAFLAGKRASIKSRPSRSGGGGSDSVDESLARHLLGLCKSGSDQAGGRHRQNTRNVYPLRLRLREGAGRAEDLVADLGGG